MRSGLNFDVIPAPDKVLPLLDNANLSAGGDAIDVTDVMHPSYKETAIRLSRDMGLRYSDGWHHYGRTNWKPNWPVFCYRN